MEHEAKPILRSRKDAARILGVSTRTVDDLIAAGVISHVKILRRTMIADTEILRVSREGATARHEAAAVA